MLENWADIPSTRYQLSQVVRQLVKETVSGPRFIRMPSGSSVDRGGWDGYLEVAQGNDWVPDGTSGWEFSCREDVKRKATADYNSRTDTPLGEDPASSTFVFVTPRKWDFEDRQEWVQERKSEGLWCDVLVLDADDLVNWLEEAPKTSESLLRLMFAPVFQNVESRYEQRIFDSTVGFSAEISKLTAEVRRLSNLVISPVSSSDHLPTNAEVDELSRKVDIGSELVNRGLIEEAYDDLIQLYESDAVTDSALRFRVVTNLAACELARGHDNEACSLLDEAYVLQPNDVRAIGNAALAAGLRQEHQYALELAERARALNPQDSQATAALITALWESDEKERFEGIVSSETWIVEDRRCSLALAAIRERESRYTEAIALYRSLVESDDTDAEARIALSRALLTNFQIHGLPADYEGRVLDWLSEAEDQSSIAIGLLENKQLQVNQHLALVARASARTLLGNLREAEDDLNSVLEDSPSHADANYNLGLLLLSRGKPAEARAALENIDEVDLPLAAVLPLADAYLQLDAPRDAVNLLQGAIDLVDPGWDQVRGAELLLKAERLAGLPDSVGSTIEDALERDPCNPKLLSIHAARSIELGNSKDAQTYLLRAIENAPDEEDSKSTKTRLGVLYESEERFAEAALLFADVTDGDPTHPNSIGLLLCLNNSGQLKEALQLARGIRETYNQPPRFVIEIEAQILEFAGDLSALSARLSELCSRDDSVATDKLRLALAQLRCVKSDSALKLARSINLLELANDPISLIKLAQMKRILGESDYLEDAYNARRFGLRNGAVHLAYFQLFTGREKDWVEPEEVSPGCVVRLSAEGEESWWHILGEDEQPRNGRELIISDQLTQMLLGKSVGHSICPPGGHGNRSYEIIAIQSKYVRAFQEVAEDFGLLFPEDERLFQISVDDLPAMVDERDEYIRSVEALYSERRIPVDTLAQLMGVSVPEVWREYTRHPDRSVNFSTGNDLDAATASRILINAEELVLSMSGLLTIHELGLLDHLLSRFSRVAIPQQVFDEVQNLSHKLALMGRPTGRIGRDEMGNRRVGTVTSTAWSRWEMYVQSLLQFAASLERLPRYPILDIDEPDQMIDALTEAGAGSVCYGREENTISSVLVTDDLVLAQVSRYLNRRTVNTQDLLVELLRSQSVTEAQYASLIERLASLNYSFVRCRGKDIVLRLGENNYMTSNGTRAMLKTLEGPSCPEDSAISVGADVVSHLANNAPPHETYLILSLILDHLWRGAGKDGHL